MESPETTALLPPPVSSEPSPRWLWLPGSLTPPCFRTWLARRAQVGNPLDLRDEKHCFSFSYKFRTKFEQSFVLLSCSSRVTPFGNSPGWVGHRKLSLLIVQRPLSSYPPTVSCTCHSQSHQLDHESYSFGWIDDLELVLLWVFETFFFSSKVLTDSSIYFRKHPTRSCPCISQATSPDSLGRAEML